MANDIVFGIRPVAEAIQTGKQIERLYIRKGAEGQLMTELRDLAFRHRIRVQEVPVEKLNRLTRLNHQGVVAQIAPIEYVELTDILERVPEDETPLIMLFDGVTDVRNFGAIARSAECAGAHGVIIPSRRAVGLTPVVAKCSAGAVEYMRVAKVTNISQTIEKLKKAGLWDYGASMEGKNYSSVKMDGAVALVIGAEGEGLSQLVKKNCDQLVSLPQRGRIDSLNASVAAGILIYDCLRQRGDK